MMQKAPIAMALAGFVLAITLVVWQVNKTPSSAASIAQNDGAEGLLDSQGDLESLTVLPEDDSDRASQQLAPKEAVVERPNRAAPVSARQSERIETPPPPTRAVHGTDSEPVTRPKVSPRSAAPRNSPAESAGVKQDGPIEGAAVEEEEVDIFNLPEDPAVLDENPEPPSLVVPPAPPRRIAETSAPVLIPVSPETSPTEPAPLPKWRTLPEGTVLEVRLAEFLSTEQNETGDSFRVILDRDIESNGEVVLGKGTILLGTIEEAVVPGRVKGRAELTFSLTGISLEDRQYPIRTNAITMEAESTKGKDVAKVGAATAIGAVLGAVFGGKKGAAIGGAAGAGAGTGGVLIGRGEDVELEREQLFSFRLEEAVELAFP